VARDAPVRSPHGDALDPDYGLGPKDGTMDSDETRETEPATERATSRQDPLGAVDGIRADRADQRETETRAMVNGSRRGYGLVLFLVGIIIGAAVAVVGPRYAQPYLGDVGSAWSPNTPLTGTVVEKRPEGERLLLRISTEEGVALAIFTQNLEDINLLIEQGDWVELGAGRYEPFLHDPGIHRVRPAEISTQGESPTPPTVGTASQEPTAHRPGTGTEPFPADEARVEYQGRMEDQLAQLEAEIIALERQLTSTGTGLSSMARRQLDELNERRAAARAKMAEIRAATADAWQDLRVGLEETWENLRVALMEARSRFGEDAPAPQGAGPEPVPASPSDDPQETPR